MNDTIVMASTDFERVAALRIILSDHSPLILELAA
jgi:hypothetical protein